MLISPSLNVSVSCKFESVLFYDGIDDKDVELHCIPGIRCARSIQRIEIFGDRRSGI